MLLGVTHCVRVSVCVSAESATAHRISLGGEGNALYPVLSSYPLAFSRASKFLLPMSSNIVWNNLPI